MDEQWLREWSAGECEYPPKTLREDVGALLAVVTALRPLLGNLEGSRWDEVGLDVLAAVAEIQTLLGDSGE